MGRVEFHVNSEQLEYLLKQFNCSKDALNLMIKESLLKNNISRVEPEKLQTKEIKKILGIKKGNDVKKIREKGLHFRNNVLLYLNQFIGEWLDDPFKLYELAYTVTQMADNELLVREYVKRLVEQGRVSFDKMQKV